MWAYTDKVKEHFFSPKNAKAVEEANAVGDVGSIQCGDALRLTLKVDPENEIILDAGFQTFGCGSAIASSSLATEWIKGKTIDEAMSISNTEIVEELSLPPVKIHCSVLAEDAIKAAVEDYKRKSDDEGEQS